MRGLNPEGITHMTVGALVDYIAEWNDLNSDDSGKKKSRNKKDKDGEPIRKRRATQGDWDAFLG